MLVGAAFIATLSGCPGGAELEHPEKYFSTPVGGAAGGGGSGGMAPVDVALPLVEGCDITAVVGRNCSINFCHRPSPLAPAGAATLNLIPDNGFVARVKDVPATHSETYCGSIPCETIPPECPVGDKLVDSDDYTQSWIMRKMNDAVGCGDLMPPIVMFTPEDKLCLENLVKAVAELP